VIACGCFLGGPIFPLRSAFPSFRLRTMSSNLVVLRGPLLHLVAVDILRFFFFFSWIPPSSMAFKILKSFFFAPGPSPKKFRPWYALPQPGPASFLIQRLPQSRLRTPPKAGHLQGPPPKASQRKLLQVFLFFQPFPEGGAFIEFSRAPSVVPEAFFLLFRLEVNSPFRKMGGLSPFSAYLSFLPLCCFVCSSIDFSLSPFFDTFSAFPPQKDSLQEDEARVLR